MGKNNCLEAIKIKDHQIEFQKMVIDIAFNFMNINPENYDKNVNELLRKVALFFNVDRTYLFTLNHIKSSMTYSHEWCNMGIKPEVDTIKDIDMESFPWWLDQLEKNNLVYVEDVELMPSEAKMEQEQLRRQGVKSLVSVPIIVDGEMQAFIGIDSVKSTKKWTEKNIEALNIMAKIISSGIKHINYHEKIDFLAYRDSLTGLPNLSLLTDRVKQGMLSASRKKTSIGIVLINLDGFKIINDTLGHDQGDELLKQVSKRLVYTVRKSDTVSRIGGDEFILYLNGYQDERSLDLIASKIIDIFKKPFILKNQEYSITGSLGIAQYPIDGDNIKTLFKNADMAMNEAKKLGKNQYHKSSEELKNSTLETILLTDSLYRAIEKKQMMLYYQPTVDGLTGEIVGVEALLRWNHPNLGFVPPFKFIPLAEKTRLILPIGNWVLKTACEQLKKWQEKGLQPVKMAVNFSVHQFNDPTILEQIEVILEKTAIDPEDLEIEITESVAMNTKENIKESLKQIKKMGISLSIDDFGKEYSSFGRLKELPIDKLKIDMSFVQGIGTCYKDEIIIKSIISLASDFGYETIGEGVETKEQIDFLNKYNCDQLQGYYFYKPMPADEMEKLLAIKTDDLKIG